MSNLTTNDRGAAIPPALQELKDIFGEVFHSLWGTGRALSESEMAAHRERVRKLISILEDDGGAR